MINHQKKEPKVPFEPPTHMKLVINHFYQNRRVKGNPGSLVINQFHGNRRFVRNLGSLPLLFNCKIAGFAPFYIIKGSMALRQFF